MICAIYARKSQDQLGVADDAKSVPRQVERATAYARGKGWTVAREHVYTDDGISGGEFQRRPGFLRLMNVLKPRLLFDVLVVNGRGPHPARVDRDRVGAQADRRVGLRLFSYLTDRERTFNSAMDKVALSLATFDAELEREKARARKYDVMLGKAKAGYVTGGVAFGYDNVRVDGHVERRFREVEAAVVRRIFELYAAGLGLRAIARILTAEGAPPPKPR